MGGTRRWLPLLPALLVLLAWLPAVQPGTVNLDTPWLVTDNPLLSTGSARVLPAILWDLSPGTRRLLGAEYLPVRDLSVLLDFAVFGRCWAAHHAVNVLLYLLACLVLYRGLFRRALGPGWRAAGAGLLFALHPVHVESVAWLASRKDVLGLLFVALALSTWLSPRWRERPWGRALLVALLAALAAWSKSTSVALLPLLALASFLLLREPLLSWRSWLPLLPTTLVLGLAAVVAGRVGAMVGMYAPVRGGSLPAALLLETRVLLWDLGLLLWPARLSVVHPEPQPQPLLHPASLLGLGGFLALLLVLALAWRRRPVLAFGVGALLAGLLPVSQLVPIQNLLADRYLLLPSIGFAVALFSLLPEPATAGQRRAWLLLGLPLALALAARTALRCRDFRDGVALWRSALAVYPDFDRARVGLAGALREAGRAGEAEALLREGLEERPGSAALWQELGVTLWRLGRVREAEVAFRRCLALEPRRRRARDDLARLLLARGELEEAERHARFLVGAHPLYPAGWNTLGAVLLERGELEEARSALLRALELDPLDAATLCNLGSVAWSAGELEQAERWWQRCLARDPGKELARQGLAAVRARRAGNDQATR